MTSRFIFYHAYLKPEIEGDVELYVVTDVFWQKEKGTKTTSDKTFQTNTPANNSENFCTGGFCPALFVLLKIRGPRCATYFRGLARSGASIPPETMMHFPPVSDFPPYFRKMFGLSEKF